MLCCSVLVLRNSYKIAFWKSNLLTLSEGEEAECVEARPRRAAAGPSVGGGRSLRTLWGARCGPGRWWRGRCRQRQADLALPLRVVSVTDGRRVGKDR